MPIYEYRCMRCNEQFEITQRITDDPLSTCELCGSQLKRLITNTSFVLKGGGWYVTDYPSSDRKKAMEEKKKTTGDSNKQDVTTKEAVGSK